MFIDQPSAIDMPITRLCEGVPHGLNYLLRLRLPSSYDTLPECMRYTKFTAGSAHQDQ